MQALVQIIIKDSSKFFQKALNLRRNGFAAIEYHSIWRQTVMKTKPRNRNLHFGCVVFAYTMVNSKEDI